MFWPGAVGIGRYEGGGYGLYLVEGDMEGEGSDDGQRARCRCGHIVLGSLNLPHLMRNYR